MKNIIYFGTYEKNYPRNRLFIRALSKQFSLTELHCEIWGNNKNKTKLFNPLGLSKVLFALARSYIKLFVMLKKTVKRGDIVLTGFPGQFDLFFLVLVRAILPPIKIVANPLVSFYDTIVEDRALLADKGILAKMLKTWEKFLFRKCSMVITDTIENKKYFCEKFCLNPNKVEVVYVGADTSVFKPIGIKKNEIFTVLFYGTYIPLHGIENIIEAVKLCPKESIKWMFVGDGQLFEVLEPKLNNLIKSGFKIEVIRWIEYEKLNDTINKSHIALGIFGTTEKSKRVIPNKLFQAVASATPVITASSDAIKEIFDESVLTTTSNDSASIAEKIIFAKEHYSLLNEKAQRAYNSFFYDTDSEFGIFEKKLFHTIAKLDINDC